jgi:hypothetical protein
MFLPSAFTSIEPGATNFVGPCVFADTRPPPVPLDGRSPMLLNDAPLIATTLPSNFTFLVASLRLSPDLPMFGSGVGTNGAGGPGILHTLGIVAAAMPLEPLVTGVRGGLTPTFMPWPPGARE